MSERQGERQARGRENGWGGGVREDEKVDGALLLSEGKGMIVGWRANERNGRMSMGGYENTSNGEA